MLDGSLDVLLVPVAGVSRLDELEFVGMIALRTYEGPELSSKEA